MIDIDSIFDMLYSHNETHIQEQGIKKAKRIRHLSILIMPCESKLLWENCAKVLTSKTDAELEPYLMPLLSWLQDMNWPGANLMYQRFLQFDTDKLILPWKICMKMAAETDDEPWINVLNTLKNEMKMDV